jgi:hypothetical protein
MPTGCGEVDDQAVADDINKLADADNDSAT